MTVTIKTPDDIEKMRIAGRLAAEVLEMIGEHIKPGVTTEELDRICHDYIVNEQKAIPAPLNYKGFPKSICTSINHVVCHGIPNEKPLKEGDILNVDITVIKDGYHGDTSKMFLVGKTRNGPTASARSPRNACTRAFPWCVRARTWAISAKSSRSTRKERLLGGPRILRPWHRQGVPRGAAGPPLRSCGYRHRAEGRHDLHHRADDQPGPPGDPPARRRLDRDHQDRKLSAQWEHTVLVTADGYEILTLRNDETFPRTSAA